MEPRHAIELAGLLARAWLGDAGVGPRAFGKPCRADCVVGLVAHFLDQVREIRRAFRGPAESGGDAEENGGVRSQRTTGGAKMTPATPEEMNLRSTYPNGSCFLATSINSVDRATLSVAAPFISRDFGLGPAELGLVLGAFFWTYAISAVVLAISAALFSAGAISAIVHVILWCVSFFFASGG